MVSIQESLKRIDEKKKKLDLAKPLPPELENNLQEWFVVEFIYASNALEGNTLSSSEVAIVIEKDIVVGGKQIREYIEILDSVRAVTFITSHAKKQKKISFEDILELHKIVSDTKVSFLMVDFISWLQEAQDHPVIVAALAHYKLVTIHPFVDGNGRTARLLMNLLLLQQGYPLAIIKNEQRPEYIAAIEYAREADDFDQFYKVIISAVEYSLDIYLEAIVESDL
jgi:Fic family protein